jgi:hypothetical protein
MKLTTSQEKMTMATTEQQIEALMRARSGYSKNDAIVFIEMTERGYTDVRPRENVFTFNAWKAQGRVVKKGEKGLPIVTWIPCKKQAAAGEEGKKLRPKTAHVFHFEQTQAIDDQPEAVEPVPAETIAPAMPEPTVKNVQRSLF